MLRTCYIASSASQLLGEGPATKIIILLVDVLQTLLEDVNTPLSSVTVRAHHGKKAVAKGNLQDIHQTMNKGTTEKGRGRAREEAEEEVGARVRSRSRCTMNHLFSKLVSLLSLAVPIDINSLQPACDVPAVSVCRGSLYHQHLARVQEQDVGGDATAPLVLPLPGQPIATS
eukprot:766680-Hanusia_phi.AAC.3